MIKKKKTKQQETGSRSTQTIHIEFLDSIAEAVSIAGTFNDWRPEVTPMIAAGEGRWVKNLTLPPGRYEYCLVIDGWKWVPNPQTADSVPNPFGGRNSVLRVPEPA